jgi:hypothetical protein
VVFADKSQQVVFVDKSQVVFADRLLEVVLLSAIVGMPTDLPYQQVHLAHVDPTQMQNY